MNSVDTLFIAPVRLPPQLRYLAWWRGTSCRRQKLTLTTRQRPCVLAHPVSQLRSNSNGVIIIPGKFDSFHVGHRRLAEYAARSGVPTFMSFSGMSTALGWAPRPSVVADVERDHILRAWSRVLGVSVEWRPIPFDQIRNMAPVDFVQFIVDQFSASGIVCGPDWRFGKNRAGDVNQLCDLGLKFNIGVTVVDPVDIGGTVSSTRIRAALAEGNVELASVLMGRYHRAIGYTTDVETTFVYCRAFRNMLPAPSHYNAVVRVIGRPNPIRTLVTVIDDGGERCVRIPDVSTIDCTECEVQIDFISCLRS